MLATRSEDPSLRRSFFITCILVLVCLAGLPCSAGSRDYLQDMPSVETVRHEFGGFTDVQAAGKQAAALKALGMVIKELSAGGEFQDNLTDEERAVSDRYFAAALAVRQATVAKLTADGGPTSGPKSPRTRVSRAMMKYDNDGFRHHVAQRLLPPAVKARYSNLHPNLPAPGAIFLLLGAVAAAVLIVGLYFKLFPARPGDGDIVGFQTNVSVVGGVGVAHTRAVTRRESMMLRRALLFALLLAPFFAAGIGLILLVGPYISVLEPLLNLADDIFYGAIDFVECWTL